MRGEMINAHKILFGKSEETTWRRRRWDNNIKMYLGCVH
jgi:hypothetical protein